VTIKEGEKVRSNLSGKIYEIKTIKNKLVILDAEDRSDWIITGKGMLRMFYKKLENKTRENYSDFIFRLSSTPPENL